MRIIEDGETGTEIYPLVSDGQEVCDDDFCIAVDSKETVFIDGRMLSRGEVEEVISSLERALEIMDKWGR